MSNRKTNHRRKSKEFDFAAHPRFIDTVETEKRTFYKDSEQRGLYLRVQKDHRTFIFSGWIAGQAGERGRSLQAPLPVGAHDSLHVGEARELARAYRKAAQAGRDPTQSLHEGLSGDAGATTLPALLRAYARFAENVMGRSQRTCEDHRDRADHLDRIGGWIAHTPLAKLTATGLDQWLGEYEADAQRRHGVSGRRGRNLYAMAFNVALAWAGNVHRGARKFPNREPMLAPEQARALLTTVLPEDGDGASGGAMDDEPDETIVHGVKTKYSPLELAEARTLLSVLREKRATSEVAPLIEYILLTGERSGAARSLKWKHVDRPAGRITVPAGIRKNRLPLLVPITAALQRLLDAQAGHPMAVDRESYMFPSTAGHTAGVGRVEHKLNGQLSSSCGTIRAECSRIGHPVQRFSPQSLRVTVAVGLSELGVPQETREMVLGDKPQGIVRQHYDQPKAHLSRVQDALEQWHATIGAD